MRAALPCALIAGLLLGGCSAPVDELRSIAVSKAGQDELAAKLTQIQARWPAAQTATWDRNPDVGGETVFRLAAAANETTIFAHLTGDRISGLDLRGEPDSQALEGLAAAAGAADPASTAKKVQGALVEATDAGREKWVSDGGARYAVGPLPAVAGPGAEVSVEFPH